MVLLSSSLPCYSHCLVPCHWLPYKTILHTFLFFIFSFHGVSFSFPWVHIYLNGSLKYRIYLAYSWNWIKLALYKLRVHQAQPKVLLGNQSHDKVGVAFRTCVTQACVSKKQMAYSNILIYLLNFMPSFFPRILFPPWKCLIDLTF